MVRRNDISMVRTLKDEGERNLIELVKSIIQMDPSNNMIGDDCAILPFGDQFILISTDMVSKKTHLSPVMSYKDIGWFVTAINLSDIAAKGGTPLGVLLAYGLPKDMMVSDFQDIVRGAHECASTYQTSIIGGDTKENNDLVISGTSIGVVDKNEFMGRAGAKPGDIIAVTGTVGSAAASYLAIQKGEKTKSTIHGLIHPTPRVLEGQKLAMSRKVHCCMDISDGLSASLYELQRFNDVGFQIDYSKIPVDPLLMKYCDDISLSEYLLHFGGEYELLLSASKDAFPLLQKTIAPTSLTVIGTVTKEKGITILKNDILQTLENKGYQHFTASAFS